MTIVETRRKDLVQCDKCGRFVFDIDKKCMVKVDETLQERITKFRLETFGDFEIEPKNTDDLELAKMMKEVMVHRVEQGISDLIESESLARSKADQKALLEKVRMEKWDYLAAGLNPNLNTDFNVIRGYNRALSDFNLRIDAAAAKVEGER